MTAYKRSKPEPEPEVPQKALHLRVNTSSILQAELRFAVRARGIEVSEETVYRDTQLFRLESYLWRDIEYFSTKEHLYDAACVKKALEKLRFNSEFINVVNDLASRH
jgi:hypothetical protein